MAQPLNATFFAFRKRDRALLAPAAIAYVVLSILTFVVWSLFLVLMIGGSAALSASADPSTIAPGALLAVFVFYFGLLFTYFLLTASFEAACLRWMIRGERGGLFGLTLGADTWRVYSTYWVWFFLFVGAYLGTLLVVALAIGIGVGMAANAPPAIPGLIAGVVFLLILCAIVYIAVRTAPAAAVTVGRRRFAFFDSWKVSRGRFWALFGSYLLLGLLNLLLVGGAWVVLFGTVLSPLFADIVAGGDPQAVNEAYLDMMSQPSVLAIYYGVQMVAMAIGVVFYVLGYGVNARAVQAAAEEGKIEGVINADIAKTFD